ncbi:OmpA family protein [Reichenbachiella agariperforans]|uniref:OmpA family protein n=1 Tax=Reichenbachiella agariperforans TaxID=156994 RepID=UPI001C08C632|nr:OmpA family protein [Reichenbachiella agariperforans]MBU2912827.1 OmpA family protein [Reichenbachiella agariperforans]
MRYTLLFLFVFIFVDSHAQYTSYHSEDKKALRDYEEARQLLKRAQFREAMEPMLDAVERDPDFIEVWLALGSASNRLGWDSLSFVYFKKAIRIDPDYPKSKYAYHAIGEQFYKDAVYDSAEAYLEHYIRTIPNDPVKETVAKSMIMDCRFALQALLNPFEYNIRQLADHANSFQLQYFPALSVDQQKLYFTRRVGMNNYDDEDIYFCEYDSASQVWSVPASVSDQINSEFNEGAASLSADERTLVFTSCDGRRGYGSCDIYIAQKVGDDWSKPENIGKAVNSAAWEAQPSLSADGRTILFVSNRRGGYGGKDIWMSTKNRRGEWQSAINLGKRINSNKDEISPFIHANGETIYFSSNGHEGLGGLDIYMSEIERDSLWKFPVNLGYPLNDEHDQVSLYIASDSKTGVYTIEKLTKTGFQSKLYAFDLPDRFQVTNQSAYLKGRVVDADNHSPITAEIQVYHLSNNHFYSELTSDAKTGAYTLVLTEGNRYGIYVTSPGYMFVDFSFTLEDLKSFDQNLLDIELQPIKVGASSTLGNVFFDHDDASLKPESMSELRVVYYFLRQNPKLKMEIAGHSDSEGSESYNLELSMRRAKTVHDFLISKGISPSQLSYKGYGESRLLYTGENPHLLAENRRIEFLVSEIGE